MEKGRTLWEILVPRYSNAGREYPLGHHHQWDAKIREISGGITILRTAKGHWISPEGKLFADEMIPARVYCSELEIERIVDETLLHYEQEAVLAYEISSKVKLKHKG